MNAVDDSTLEALIDGELGEFERAAVLRQLEQSTDGWRRLALAFLAEQTLRETIATLSAPMPKVPETSSKSKRDVVSLIRPAGVQALRFNRRATLRRWPLGLAACAACAVLAFLLGIWTSRSITMIADATTTKSPDSSVAIKHPAESPSPAVSSAGRTSVQPVASAMPSVSASTRKELERRGFVVQERPRVVSLRQDGRIIQVLVNEIELRYVGQHSAL